MFWVRWNQLCLSCLVLTYKLWHFRNPVVFAPMMSYICDDVVDCFFFLMLVAFCSFHNSHKIQRVLLFIFTTHRYFIATVSVLYSLFFFLSLFCRCRMKSKKSFTITFQQTTHNQITKENANCFSFLVAWILCFSSLIFFVYLFFSTIAYVWVCAKSWKICSTYSSIHDCIMMTFICRILFFSLSSSSCSFALWHRNVMSCMSITIHSIKIVMIPKSRAIEISISFAMSPVLYFLLFFF